LKCLVVIFSLVSILLPAGLYQFIPNLEGKAAGVQLVALGCQTLGRHSNSYRRVELAFADK
jgi:hypothetical protein